MRHDLLRREHDAGLHECRHTDACCCWSCMGWDARDIPCPACREGAEEDRQADRVAAHESYLDSRVGGTY